MTKTGPLSKAEQFYIENKYSNDMDVGQLCKELDRTKKSVQNFITKNDLVKSEPEEKNKETLLSQQFARSGGTTVMTPNASVMADDMKASFNQNKPQRSKCVTKIKNE
jgi:hypothetical protein|tara:strand:+ start:1503 stop:1826 length:324 start_codon:yes stop_codon:yes gene_type:complete